jgi:hypothetical protein
MRNGVFMQRIATVKELSEVLSLSDNEIYKRNSAKTNTTLAKEGIIAVKKMHIGQYDAVTYNKDTGDSHVLLVLEMPRSRIVERGKGLYLDYIKHNEVLVDEYIIIGYRPKEVIAVYNIADLYFTDVYGAEQYGSPNDIHILPIELCRKS